VSGAATPPELMSRQKRFRPAATSTTADSLTPAQRVCEELRQIQWQTNCSTQTLQCLLDSLRDNLGSLVKTCVDLPRKATYADKTMQQLVRDYLYCVALFVTEMYCVVYNRNVLFVTGRRKGGVFTWLCGARLQQSLGPRRCGCCVQFVWYITIR